MKSKSSFFVILAILLCSALVLAGCSGKSNSGSSSGQTIKIGWVAPMTGVCANDGQQMLNGAKLAAKEINAAGGVNGKQIELDSQDDKSDPKEAANIATKFTADSSILAVLGNYNSSCVLSGAPIYESAKLPVIHVGTSPVFTQQNFQYLFRISVTDAFQSDLVTKWLYDDGHKNVGILYENDDYGRGIKDAVTKDMGNLGGKVAGAWSYELGQTKDYSPLLTSAKNAGADSLFIAGLYTEGALIGKQMSTVGLNVPVYGTDGLYEKSLITLGGAAVEGFHVSGLFTPDDARPAIKSFINAYKAEYNNTPGTYAALDYDAMKLMAKAIAAVGTDKDKIQAYLAKMPQPYDGVTGTVTFDEHHDALRPTMEKLTVKNGQWVIYQK